MAQHVPDIFYGEEEETLVYITIFKLILLIHIEDIQGLSWEL